MVEIALNVSFIVVAEVIVTVGVDRAKDDPGGRDRLTAVIESPS